MVKKNYKYTQSMTEPQDCETPTQAIIGKDITSIEVSLEVK